MDFNADHFALFELPRAFRLESALLDKRYREILALVHPDKFAHASDAERRLSLQWATRINEAYLTLKKPLARGRYLLELLGHPVDEENNTLMPTEFLMEQMEWREAVAEARQACDQEELEKLRRRVKARQAQRYEQLAEALDDRQDYVFATERVCRLMFLEKLIAEIDNALTELDA